MISVKRKYAEPVKWFGAVIPLDNSGMLAEVELRPIRARLRNMSLEDSDITHWFAREVQPHGAALRTWLRGRFPSLHDADDLVQEAFARVCLAYETGRIVSPRAFLFTTARNLALDRVRRHQIVNIESLAEIESLPVYSDEDGVPEAVAKTQELELLTQAIQSLPNRCRRVLTLRKIYGLSQREIATQLGITEHTVEAQVGIGMRRCAEFLARHGLP